jgi:hypothetical protein
MREKRSGAAVLAGAMLLAISIGRANANSDNVSCQSIAPGQLTKQKADGTSCSTEVDGTGSNIATATASNKSQATALAKDGATATANAAKGSKATAQIASDVVAGSGVATSSGKLAKAVVSISFGGSGTSTARGGHSFASSSITGDGGGTVQATAIDGASVVAEVGTNGGGSAFASGKKGGEATAMVLFNGGGTASATAHGKTSNSSATVSDNCEVTTIADGFHSSAMGDCRNPGSIVTVKATNGSSASGSDANAPVCHPVNGGIARVRSPAGNCG